MAKVNISLPLAYKDEKFKLGVWSSKGGVGKTTLSIAIAYSLANYSKTGLLDADISSPNITEYLEIEEQLVGDKEKNIIYPIIKDNLEIISMGSIAKSDAVIWRGILLSKAAEDFIKRVEWSSNRIVIDLPPGTSDILITLTNTIPLNSFILITTPSKLALKELERSINFLERFKIPIIGVIENMVSDAYPSISDKIEALGLEVLASLPYSKEIAQAVEKGAPINSLFPKEFSKISEKILSLESNLKK